MKSIKASKAQAIRFGILAARHALERGRLTDWQVDYLEGCETVGWIVGDWGTSKAWGRECSAAIRRGMS